MILLNGVSGFIGNAAFDTDLEVIGAECKKHCYSIIDNLGGEVLTWNELEVGRNYYYVQVKVFDECLYILLNAMYPFIAISSSAAPGGLDYIDHEQLWKGFSLHYHVLRADELNELLVIKEVKDTNFVENNHQLSEAEFYNIKYWRPKTVGDIVFNYWD
ncbi:hypothetical protein [Solibacillus sp. FSL H8-0538]|uniref:hypothetical protein n=1 Tax=Solibacillus sp. FSL H8-0538 TaxID=2921400 RepID=UPI0030F5B409